MIMKVEIKNEKENPFLKRKELNIIIEHPDAATPTKASLQQYLAKELKKDIQQIEIKNIFSVYGEQKSTAKVFVWEEKKAPDYSKIVKKKEGEKGESESKGKEEEKDSETEKGKEKTESQDKPESESKEKGEGKGEGKTEESNEKEGE